MNSLALIALAAQIVSLALSHPTPEAAIVALFEGLNPEELKADVALVAQMIADRKRIAATLVALAKQAATPSLAKGAVVELLTAIGEGKTLEQAVEGPAASVLLKAALVAGFDPMLAGVDDMVAGVNAASASAIGNLGHLVDDDGNPIPTTGVVQPPPDAFKSIDAAGTQIPEIGGVPMNELVREAQGK